MTPLENLETLALRFDGPVLHLTLNRPETKNAMNFRMVAELTTVFETLKQDRSVRAIVLGGAEGTFCAGGDIKEMADALTNKLPAKDSSGNLDTMLRACNEAAQVVVAKVEGAALGGGFGLVCVSDIAIASTTAKFGLPEVRLGVAPAFISPFVIQRIGLTRARELMLTGRRFDGQKAKEYGIVTEVCSPDDLDNCVETVLDEIRQCGPNALAAVKQLIFTVMDRPLDETVDFRAEMLHNLRQSEEAQEGMMAFIQKRPAKWVSGDNGA